MYIIMDNWETVGVLNSDREIVEFWGGWEINTYHWSHICVQVVGWFGYRCNGEQARTKEHKNMGHT